MRPIVEVMTVNFSLLAPDQIVNNAGAPLHMSGGQYPVPLVIRMTTGAGRQLAAQHSHSLEGWYAHVPGSGRRARDDRDAPACPAGAERPRPRPALRARVALHHRRAAARRRGAPSTSTGAVRRPGTDVTLIAYGGTVARTLEAAEALDAEGMSAEVVDLRTLPAVASTTPPSWARSATPTGPVVVDEGWRSGSLSAEIVARIQEQAFYDLDAPVERVCSAEVPMPHAHQLEAAAPRRSRRSAAAPPHEGVTWPITMPSPGRRHGRGHLLEWLVHPGDVVRKGDVPAVVDTSKSAVGGRVVPHRGRRSAAGRAGHDRAVGTVLATITGGGAAPPRRGPRAPAAAPKPKRAEAVHQRAAAPCGPAGPHGDRAGPLPSSGATRRGWAWTSAACTAPAWRDDHPRRRTARQPPASAREPVRPPAGGRARRRPEAARPAGRRGRAGRGRPCPPVVRRRRRHPAPPTAPAAAPPCDDAAGRDVGRDRGHDDPPKREVPHYYLTNTVDLSTALAWMHDRNRDPPVQGALVPAALVLLHAVAAAARATPALNGFFVDGAFRPGDGVHVGVAISLRGGGLVAPAILDADALTVEGDHGPAQDLVLRTRASRLRSRELSDPTITVTNLGDQGVESV